MDMAIESPYIPNPSPMRLCGMMSVTQVEEALLEAAWNAVRRAQYNGRRDACRYEITHRDECHADKSQYQYRVSSPRVDEPSHERSRYDGSDAEQCRCQSDSYRIAAQVGDEEGESRQQRMKIYENKEIHQADS